ncbi:MAG: hypothetical protein J07HN6_00660 [Halonotius sp. J07HN6]|nr:MAG: hypothetical protein J07HN6_00660 [Halonotius sp. J07HN6]
MTDTADEYVIEGGHVLTPDFDVIEADVLIDRTLARYSLSTTISTPPKRWTRPDRW